MYSAIWASAVCRTVCVRDLCKFKGHFPSLGFYADQIIAGDRRPVTQYRLTIRVFGRCSAVSSWYSLLESPHLDCCTVPTTIRLRATPGYDSEVIHMR